MITIFYRLRSDLKELECSMDELRANLNAIKTQGGIIIGIGNDKTIPKLVKTY